MVSQKASHAAKKARLRTKTRVGYAVYLVNKGVAPSEAAKRALVSLPRLRRALGTDNRLTEGSAMDEATVRFLTEKTMRTAREEGLAVSAAAPLVWERMGRERGPYTVDDWHATLARLEAGTEREPAKLRDASEDATELGAAGVPYNSEAAESLIADRLQQLRASGRPADRMAVRGELVSAGKIASWSDDTSSFEAELNASLAPEQRERVAAAQQTAAQRETAERARQQARIAWENSAPKPATPNRQGLIRQWTSQGYSKADAESRADFALREAARARGEKWEG